MASLKHDPVRLRKVAAGVRAVHDRVSKAAAEAARNRFKHSRLQKYRQWSGRDFTVVDLTPSAIQADHALQDATPSIDDLYEELGGFRIALLEYIAHMDKVAETCAKGIDSTAARYEKLDNAHAKRAGS